MGGFFGTNVGHFQPLGMEGWRLAFHLVAAISLTTAFLVFYHATDPRRKVCTHQPRSATAWLPILVPCVAQMGSIG